MNPSRAVILLVDDESLVCDYASKALEYRGYKVYVAQWSSEALQIFRDHLNDIDLVVTDINMPGMRGPKMAWIMRQDRPELPLLFISGRNDELPGLDEDNVRPSYKAVQVESIHSGNR